MFVNRRFEKVSVARASIKGLNKGLKYFLEGPKELVIPCACWHGHVNAIALSFTFSHFFFKAGLEWKKSVPTFMKGKGHDPVTIIKGLLDLITMMGVYIDIQDTIIAL